VKIQSFRSLAVTRPAGSFLTIAWLSLCLLLSGTGGCGGPTASRTASGPPRQDIEPKILQEYRDRWLARLDSAQARSITEIRLAASSPPQTPAPAGSTTVVVTGRVGAGKQLVDPGSPYPWEPGKACFMIGEPKLDQESHRHGPEDAGCPFCARKARNGSALIRFLEQEQPVPIDSRTLFGLQEGQDVVVQGVASLNSVDQLVVDAERLWIIE